jgi:peptide deformylase
VQIIKYPHPTLRHRSKPLLRVDGDLKYIVRQMFDLMYEQKGIGLAANQVDLPYRFFIMNLEADPAKAEEFVFINPLISRRRGSDEGDEGCLSFPDIYAPVKRSEKLLITAYNLAGEQVGYELSGLFARTVQHEYDHLDGILFIDRLSPTALAAIEDALLDLERQFQGDRHRGVIPDDHQIATRLAELESLRT